MPQFFFAPKQYRYRFDCIGFENRPPKIENIQKKFLRAQVATCWYLSLSGYPSFEEYLKELSSGSRKKIRKLEKMYRDEQIEFVPMTATQIWKTCCASSSRAGRTASGVTNFATRCFRFTGNSKRWGSIAVSSCEMPQVNPSPARSATAPEMYITAYG